MDETNQPTLKKGSKFLGWCCAMFGVFHGPCSKPDFLQVTGMQPANRTSYRRLLQYPWRIHNHPCQVEGREVVVVVVVVVAALDHWRLCTCMLFVLCFCRCFFKGDISCVFIYLYVLYTNASWIHGVQCFGHAPKPKDWNICRNITYRIWSSWCPIIRNANPNGHFGEIQSLENCNRSLPTTSDLGLELCRTSIWFLQI